ncbi:biotin--protein ligase isoform X2 [Conger conger]|uniref:biotin--protein ligase isoform X2 n=1 Tax=Conger conger TaxID=82655 RepID=UPI002A5A49EF|nr:biotin--protein ligase isoform X2 [Conger conger]
MLITLCYVYLWVRFQKCYTLVIRSTVNRLCGTRSSFTFCAVKPPIAQSWQDTGDQSFIQQQRSTSTEDTVFLKLGNKACDDISKWTLLLGSSVAYGPRTENIAFVIEAASGQRVGNSPTSSNKKVLKWSDHCLPLACSPGQPYKAVAEASAENFSRLGVAFMENRLRMDHGLIPEKIVSVFLKDSALEELVEKKRLESRGRTELISDLPVEEPSPCKEENAVGRGATPHASQESSLRLPPTPAKEGQRCLEERRVLEGRRSSGPRAEEEDGDCDSTRGSHMEGHHHLHLSSCHECQELENSTILSVKFASAENIPDLPDDYGGEEGESEEEGEGFAGQTRRVNPSGKPPNVLVYTGGCLERFERVRSVLAECVDTDNYTVYPLRPQQALSEPWLDSALLLVLASDEALTPQLHERFLAYLGRGGKVLGLCSTFCPGPLSVVPREAQRNRVHRLSFTKADSSELELSVMAGGRAFEREGALGPKDQVELWGELHGDARDMAIVRVTHGEEGGEAILCQVRLETAPDSQEVERVQDFDELKMSNTRRYEVLTEVLSSLGLSCELSQVPPPSPVYLLSASPESRSQLLAWLQRQVDGEGLLKSPKAKLKVVSCVEPQLVLPEGVLALVTEPPEVVSQQFSLETYCLNLRTRTLGQSLLFAEVTPTTMDLLEGLMLQLPQEVGLIAVAARQTQGKGRGGNAWLSPLGCAMFSLHVQVPVSSRLGQRIPFLQHLAALAVVEAVRTLPGYEDIDLRLKWPNDIYYCDLMKLGGVLVNSTLMGPTFHLLIGCGFNVSNSNPTICINDLVVQHNRERGTALEPLGTDQLIARTVTVLEKLICDFQEQGPQAVLPLYYKRWVHGGTQVRLWSEDGPKAAVVGLDDNGFLQVRSQEQGVVSVQPDGNSFDMLRNLVVSKHS